MFLTTAADNMYLSSSLVKQVAGLGLSLIHIYSGIYINGIEERGRGCVLPGGYLAL